MYYHPKFRLTNISLVKWGGLQFIIIQNLDLVLDHLRKSNYNSEKSHKFFDFYNFFRT